MVGLHERLERYRVAERCAEMTPEIIEFWISCFRNRKFSPSFRAAMADKLMDRAFGRPALAVNVDATSREMSLEKVIHEVRWLPPDPNDRSIEIAPEPD
jgi:hypothetical protein